MGIHIDYYTLRQDELNVLIHGKMSVQEFLDMNEYEDALDLDSDEDELELDSDLPNPFRVYYHIPHGWQKLHELFDRLQTDEKLTQVFDGSEQIDDGSEFGINCLPAEVLSKLANRLSTVRPEDFSQGQSDADKRQISVTFNEVVQIIQFASKSGAALLIAIG